MIERLQVRILYFRYFFIENAICRPNYHHYKNQFLFTPKEKNEKNLSIKNISDLTNVSCVVCGPEYQLWCAIVPRANVGHIWLTTYLKNQEENHYKVKLGIKGTAK